MASKKILIVDDDLDVRQAMHVRLKANGYDTFFATDAFSCVAEARKQHPDLIILDLGLPGGDGYVVIQRLKEHPALAVIPIVVVSAHDLHANKDRPIKAGANVYLQKPVDSAELLWSIRHALGEPAQPEDAAITGREIVTAHDSRGLPQG
jgi:two-component system KDP operon response regulator KdpE